MNGQSCENWRLLTDLPLSGPRNMARDEALLRAVGIGDAPVTLRLYAWNPPTLSLGFGQPLNDADLRHLDARGWGLVRRMTGGRAILHTDELTYSLTVPAGHSLAAGSVIESYRRISGALAAAVRSLGVAPQAERATERGGGSAVCFETPSHYELTINGRKLVGSAQARKFGGLLQHGALPLTGDLGRIVDGLAFPDEAARATARAAVRARATTLSEAAGRIVTWAAAAAALVGAIERVFDVVLVPSVWTAEEASVADTLERDIYATPAWTARR
jgi:lipoate-protein ligase A